MFLFVVAKDTLMIRNEIKHCLQFRNVSISKCLLSFLSCFEMPVTSGTTDFASVLCIFSYACIDTDVFPVKVCIFKYTYCNTV